MPQEPTPKTQKINRAWDALKAVVAETMHDVCKLELLQKMFEKWSLDKLEGLDVRDLAGLENHTEEMPSVSKKYNMVLRLAQSLPEHRQEQLIEELGYEVKDDDDVIEDQMDEKVRSLMPDRLNTINDLSKLELLMRAYKQLSPQQIEALLRPVVDADLSAPSRYVESQVVGTPFTLVRQPVLAQA
jgi:hypothetical protein